MSRLLLEENVEANKNWEIDASAIEIVEVIGRGAFADVHKGTLYGMDVAIKKLYVQASEKDREQAKSLLQNEFKTLSLCRHQNVVQILNICFKPPMLILAFAEKGNLRDLLNYEPNMSNAKRFQLACGICNGMAMLHSRNILHLDLKPENILISKDDVPWISDFGLSKIKTMSAGSTKGERGTIQYKAPELFKSKRMGGATYSKAADVYSFAILSWELFSGKMAFAGVPENEILAMHMEALMFEDSQPERPSIDAIISLEDSEKQFIIDCWAQKPEERPTFENLSEQLKGATSEKTFNKPGHWDFFIGHSRRSGVATTLAETLHNELTAKGYTVWLDVKMSDPSTDAMKEGVENCKLFLAIVTGPCANEDFSDPPEKNAYFNRWYCLEELRWAKEAGIPIQPVVRRNDQQNIGKLMSLAPAEFKFLSDIAFMKVDRDDPDVLNLNIDKIIKQLSGGPAIDKMQEIKKEEMKRKHKEAIKHRRPEQQEKSTVQQGWVDVSSGIDDNNNMFITTEKIQSKTIQTKSKGNDKNEDGLLEVERDHNEMENTLMGDMQHVKNGAETKKSAAYIKWEKEFDGKTKVDLKEKNLTDEDALAIGELLKTNNTLTKLNLDNNNITDVQSIGEGLKTNNTLRVLNLSHNNITDDSGIQSIIDVLKTNNTLDFLRLENNQLSDNMISQLKAIQQYKRYGSNGYQQVWGVWIWA